MVLGVLGKKGLTAHYFFCFSVIEDGSIGTALSPSLASSFSQDSLGPRRTTSGMSSPRGSDASVTRKGKRWPFSRTVVDQEPAATLLQLDAVRGNVNTIVNDNIRTSYQVSDVIGMKEDALNPTVLTMVLSEERGHVYQFQTSHDMAVFRSTLLEVSAGTYSMIRFPRTVLRKGNIKKQGKTGMYFERFAVVVPQKLFIMHNRSSFFPSSTVSLIDVKPDYDEGQQTIRIQVEGREYTLKGMSQQDAKGWQQALATACMLKYDVVPLTEEVLLQEQQKAEDMLRAVTAGTALSLAPSGPSLNAVPADSGQSPKQADKSSQSAALQSKMQMLRDMGFLNQAPPETDMAMYEQQENSIADLNQALPGLDTAMYEQHDNSVADHYQASPETETVVHEQQDDGIAGQVAPPRQATAGEESQLQDKNNSRGTGATGFQMQVSDITDQQQTTTEERMQLGEGNHSQKMEGMIHQQPGIGNPDQALAMTQQQAEATEQLQLEESNSRFKDMQLNQEHADIDQIEDQQQLLQPYEAAGHDHELSRLPDDLDSAVYSHHLQGFVNNSPNQPQQQALLQSPALMHADHASHDASQSQHQQQQAQWQQQQAQQQCAGLLDADRDFLDATQSQQQHRLDAEAQLRQQPDIARCFSRQDQHTDTEAAQHGDVTGPPRFQSQHVITGYDAPGLAGSLSSQTQVEFSNQEPLNSLQAAQNAAAQPLYAATSASEPQHEHNQAYFQQQHQDLTQLGPSLAQAGAAQQLMQPVGVQMQTGEANSAPGAHFSTFGVQGSAHTTQAAESAAFADVVGTVKNEAVATNYKHDNVVQDANSSNQQDCALTHARPAQQAQSRHAQTQEAQQAQPQQAQTQQSQTQPAQTQQATALPARAKGWFKKQPSPELPVSSAPPSKDHWHPAVSPAEGFSAPAMLHSSTLATEKQIGIAVSGFQGSIASVTAAGTATAVAVDSNVSEASAASMAVSSTSQRMPNGTDASIGNLPVMAASSSNPYATVALSGSSNIVAASPSLGNTGASSSNPVTGRGAPPGKPASGRTAAGRAVWKSPEERAALAKAKGWAAKPLLSAPAPADKAKPGNKVGWHTAVGKSPQQPFWCVHHSALQWSTCSSFTIDRNHSSCPNVLGSYTKLNK